MEMRRSKVLDLLRKGETVSCVKINMSDSRVVEMAARSGIDCIWICMEHVPNDYLSMEKQILAAKAHDTDVMVRVSRGGYSDYIRPLEMDASGIMVPHIMSLADAKKVVEMTRFHPIGRRAIDGGNADGAFCGIEFLDYIKQANERRFVCIQIEDPEPLDEIEEIAALEGIDMLFFGPADFSQGIGVPGQFEHPKVKYAQKRVAEAALKYGKYAGTVGSSETAQELVDMGYKFINLGSDVSTLLQYFSEVAGNFKKRNDILQII